jgi:hypothetical protein
MSGEPTLQSLHGAIRAIPPPRPDRVVRAAFHSYTDVGRVAYPAEPPNPALDGSLLLTGIPIVIDEDVPERVCRMHRADGTTTDVPL